MTTRTKPFDPSAVKAGETKLQIENYEHEEFIYLLHTEREVCHKDRHGSLWVNDLKQVKIIEPTRIVPHDMASFPRDGWFRTSSHNLISRITDVAVDGVYFGEEFQTYESMLNIYKVVHPDGTTSPCGREEGEGV